MATRRRRGRPAATDGAQTRAKILDAARIRFAASGFARARIQEIAAEAGVTTTAVYHYFDSKAALFVEVYERGLEVLVDAYELAVAEEETLVGKLSAIISANAEINRTHAGLAEFLALAPLEVRRDADLADLPQDDGSSVTEFFQRVLEEGAERGELARGVSTGDVANLLIAAAYGLSWAHGSIGDEENHEAVLRAFQRLIRGELFR